MCAVLSKSQMVFELSCGLWHWGEPGHTYRGGRGGTLSRHIHPRTRTRVPTCRVPDPLGPADDTHTCGLVRFMFDSSHIGLSGRLPRWAVGARASHSEGAGRRAKAILVTSAAAVFVRGCRRAGPPAPRATSRPCACRARGRCEGRRLWLSSGWLRRIAMRVAGTLSRRSVEGSQLTQ